MGNRATQIADKFVSLKPNETRCPDRIAALAPNAKTIYVLKERFGCQHWDHVRDCFHKVQGSYIVTEPTAGRQYFTTKPKMVIQRLVKAGVW